ncbi:hypothetical protein LEP1GSC188_3143 [Leptospira weilii serovar Topaz str. LT2116]|uniref:Uncharacterized protein n=1 Tax=Leptospira weilii serovar Topaz str. LT2116 TaxID=1088540 RepID=M3G4H3_9LEPT|nr:hypothetical protein LEP1GSC188_3143 [Leptospira weilii serovar Topaz str. LT2116]
MKLSLEERKVVIKLFRERYRYATKKEKISILNEFVNLSGFNRNYASQVLRKKEVLKKLPTKPKPLNKRTVYYDTSVRKVLEDLWKLLDHICSKRHLSIHDVTKFKSFLDIFLGYILLSSFLLAPPISETASLKNVEVYLDTPIVLKLLGYQGTNFSEAYNELTNLIITQGGLLKIYENTYTETEGIISDCRNWLENPKFNPTSASPVLLNFIENGWKISDVDLTLQKLEGIIKSKNIEMVTGEYRKEEDKYQIDEVELRNAIIKKYNETNYRFEEWKKKDVIDKDVRSVALTHRKKHNLFSTSLSKSRYIFMTSNASLASATRELERENKGIKNNVIWSCLTDIELGTILWLNSPEQIVNYNTRRLLACCTQALQPDNRLRSLFIAELEKKKKDKTFTEDEYNFLKVHGIAIGLMMDKTLGDPDNFYPKLPEEILEEIRAAAIKGKEEESIAKIDEAQKRAEDANQAQVDANLKVIELQEKEKARSNRLNALAHKISLTISKVALVALVLIILALFYIQSLDYFSDRSILLIPIK